MTTSSINSTNFNPSYVFHSEPLSAWDLINETLKAADLEENDKDLSPLQIAIRVGNYSLCEKLILLGESVCPENTPFEETPFVFAMNQGQEDIALLLIEQDFPIHMTTDEGESLLHLSASKGFLKLCEVLIEKGIDPDISFKESRENNEYTVITPLCRAIDSRQKEVAKFLISKFKSNEIDFRIDEKEHTSLHFAVNFEYCQMLLENGANPNLSNKNGKTPLFYSIYFKSLPMCELLLKFGANPNAKDKRLESPLHLACKGQLDKFINCLLHYGADAHALSAKGKTPLYLLSLLDPFSEEFEEKYKLLIEKDQGLTIACKDISMMGHRFSLIGALFEGSTQTCTFAEIADTLQVYTKLCPNSPLSELFLEISPLFVEAAKMCSSRNVNYFMDRIEKGEITIIPLDWDLHVVSIVIKNNVVCRNNSGESCGSIPGTTFYKVEDVSDLQNLRQILTDFFSENIDRSLENRSELIKSAEKIKSQKIELFNNKLISSLKLQKLFYLPKVQKSENCTWIAAKLALKCTCILQQMKNDQNDQDVDGYRAHLFKSISIGNIFYTDWAKVDYVYGCQIAKAVFCVSEFHSFYDVDDAKRKIISRMERSKKFTSEEFSSIKELFANPIV